MSEIFVYTVRKASIICPTARHTVLIIPPGHSTRTEGRNNPSQPCLAIGVNTVPTEIGMYFICYLLNT